MARRILLVLLIVVNVVLLFRLIWTEQGILAYLAMRSRSEKLQSQLVDVDARSLELSKDIRRLQSDRNYQESIIRERMNYVKGNEVLYIFSGKVDAPEGAEGDEKKD
ncbi:MAG: septum formation initiator family protein [Proteobacteria bacterium]|nr:septum formation initiator family protein [Pseudomonadota bacterium]MBU1594717.1 septum formation initiator family protein [Pseudomonadota bacterium]